MAKTKNWCYFTVVHVPKCIFKNCYCLLRFLGCYIHCSSTSLFGCSHTSTNTADCLFLSFDMYASLLLANEISDFHSGIQLACKLRDQNSKKKFPTHTYILYRYFVHNNKYTTVLPWISVTGLNFVSPLHVTLTFGQRHPLTNSTYRPTDINVFWIPHCRHISQFKPTNLQLTGSILQK